MKRKNFLSDSSQSARTETSSFSLITISVVFFGGRSLTACHPTRKPSAKACGGFKPVFKWDTFKRTHSVPQSNMQEFTFWWRKCLGLVSTLAHSYLSNAAVQCPMLTATVTASDLIDHTIALRAVRDCLNSTGEVAGLDSHFRFINWRFHQLANVLISSLAGRRLSDLEHTIQFCFLTFLSEDQLRIVDEMVSVQSKKGRGRDIDANQFLDLLQCFTCELDLQQSGVETETAANQFQFPRLGTILRFCQYLTKIDLSQLSKRIKRSRIGRFHLFRFLKVGVSVYDFALAVGHSDLASKLLSSVYDSFFDNLEDHFGSALCKSPNDLAWVHNWTLCSTLSVLRGSISKTTMDLSGNFDIEDALRKSLFIFEKLIVTISTCGHFVNWQPQMHNSTTCGTRSDFALLYNQRLLIIGEEWQRQTKEMDSLFEGLPSLILEVIAELCFFWEGQPLEKSPLWFQSWTTFVTWQVFPKSLRHQWSGRLRQFFKKNWTNPLELWERERYISSIRRWRMSTQPQKSGMRRTNSSTSALNDSWWDFFQVGKMVHEFHAHG